MLPQPINHLKLFYDRDNDEWWIDLTCAANEGGLCNVGVGCGATEKSAYRTASKRLLRLAEEARRKGQVSRESR